MTDSKAGSPPKREPRSRPKRGEADPEQYERFLEAAHELGCEENADRLDDVVRRTAKMPPPRREPSKPTKGKKTGS